MEFRDRPKGENFVWFTAMGLGVGLLMVAFLLGLIFVNGITVFWPKKIVEVRVVDPAAGIQGSEVFAGAVTLDRMAKDLTPGQVGMKREVQYFVGNKDAYGFMFKFLDGDQIDSVSAAPGIMELERREWGNAIGYPLRLEFAEAAPFEAEEDGFLEKLEEEAENAAKRRREIRSIEKGDIGDINRKMEDLRVEQRALIRDHGEEASGLKRYVDIESRLGRLQEEYDVLAAKARDPSPLGTSSISTFPTRWALSRKSGTSSPTFGASSRRIPGRQTPRAGSSRPFSGPS